MPDKTTLLAFAAVSLGMVLAPGPNMIYLISRSISQGRVAGLISLCGVALGLTQIAISVGINAMIAPAAGSIAAFLSRRPTWLLVQRWLMGTVLAGLAVRMATESRR